MKQLLIGALATRASGTGRAALRIGVDATYQAGAAGGGDPASFVAHSTHLHQGTVG